MADSASPAPQKKRSFPRRGVKRKVKLTCRRGQFDMGANLAVALVNVAEVGACLLVKEALAPGDNVSVGFEGLQHRRPVTVTGKIIWAKPRPTGECEVGIQFDKRLPYAEIAKIA